MTLPPREMVIDRWGRPSRATVVWKATVIASPTAKTVG
jgi:hypothetical protein